MANAEQAVSTVPAEGAGILALMGIDQSKPLAAFDDLIQEDGFTALFPGVHQNGGVTAGSLEMNKNVDEDLAIPEGRRGFLGVYLGHRLSYTAWRSGLKERGADDDEDEKKAGPAYSGAISPLFAPQDARTLKNACEAYQFTPKAEKSKFDFAEDEIGHLRASCEILLYYPEAGQAITVATPYYFDSVFGKEGMLSVLKGLVDQEAGGILPVPYKVTPVSNIKSIHGNDVGVHHMSMEPVSDTKAQAVYDQFKEFALFLDTPEGEEEREKITQWLKCDDRPATEAHLVSLGKAAALRR